MTDNVNAKAENEDPFSFIKKTLKAGASLFVNAYLVISLYSLMIKKHKEEERKE